MVVVRAEKHITMWLLAVSYSRRNFITESELSTSAIDVVV
jgi:hypothetical protein